MGRAGARTPTFWRGVAVVAAAFAGLELFGAVWNLLYGNAWRAAYLPLGLVFWYWIGVGAWRRGHRAPDAASDPTD